MIKTSNLPDYLLGQEKTAESDRLSAASMNLVG
jgi:hypothetical protein